MAVAHRIDDFVTLGLMVSAIFINVLDAGPILEETINFDDPWDFQLQPHNEPLLTRKSANHELPSDASRKFDEPDVDDLEQEVLLLPEGGNGVLDPIKKIISCPVCRIGAMMLQGEVKRRSTFEQIREKFVSVCVGFNVETQPVCEGIFNTYGSELLSALKATKLEPAELCVLLLGENCGDSDTTIYDWNVKFPEIPKPEVKVNKLVKAGMPTFKVLHISDTHIDHDYKEGSVSNCKEPLCCRSYSTIDFERVIQPAGKWGTLGKCDVPAITVDNMLDNIVKQHQDIDYVIWTGDIPPHDIWNQTKEQSLDMLKDTVGRVFDVFPNVPVFPALGNHEGIPAGSFPPPWIHNEDHSISWLYNEAANQWHKWLPEHTNNTIMQGGFYSVLLRPGFRIISLNMNYCHALSWWLAVNNTDPAKELQWLIYELQQAENNEEKVHIIGHIPPGQSDCLKVWSKNYYEIITRYESTVMAQFFGHTHNDEFEVFYDTKDPKRPVNVAYIAPSVTTYEINNPSYRIYYVDGDHNETTREVIDHETWTTDLERANAEGTEPEYYKLYSARKAYHMQSLRPTEWAKLIDKLAELPGLFRLFYKHFYSNSPMRPFCDERCVLEILCDLRSGRSHDKKQLCADLKGMIK